MNWDKLVDFTSRVGFPVAVTCYLLYRWDGLMVQIVQSQTMMIELLRQHMSR